MPRAASATGSSWMRTANCWLPKIETCATPSIVDSDGEITCCGERVEIGQRNDVALQRQQQDRRIGRIDLAIARRGRSSSAAVRAACGRSLPAHRRPPRRYRGRARTGWRSRSEPSELVVEMLSMPAMVANCLISGVATDVAMVSGRGAGQLAETLMTGKSARGRAATGRTVGKQTCDHQRDRHQQRGDRPPDAELGDRHGRLSLRLGQWPAPSAPRSRPASISAGLR